MIELQENMILICTVIGLTIIGFIMFTWLTYTDKQNICAKFKQLEKKFEEAENQNRLLQIDKMSLQRHIWELEKLHDLFASVQLHYCACVKYTFSTIPESAFSNKVVKICKHTTDVQSEHIARLTWHDTYKKPATGAKIWMIKKTSDGFLCFPGVYKAYNFYATDNQVFKYADYWCKRS